ncbi:MAG: hypothetical protein FD143_3383 [Ignavibacteria bacterium]|nr:MAG: hypothetical protein FD143_3383 [Ignavibacteria bacterium]
MKCFFELFLKPVILKFRQNRARVPAHSIENAMSIQALQESFQNILVSESYQRKRDEMLKKFHTSNSAENPLFSTYD